MGSPSIKPHSLRSPTCGVGFSLTHTHSRMRALLLLLVPMALGIPIQDEAEVGSIEDMQQRIIDLFSERDGREIEVDEDETDFENLAADQSNDEKSSESLVQETDPNEIGRFNTYMDAIYRRMNAALRAKLMDPMILNLNEKDKKEKTTKKKDHKHKNKDKKDARKGRMEDSEEDAHEISKRDVEDEEENESVDRVGVAKEQEDDADKTQVEEGQSRNLKKHKKGKKGGNKKEQRKRKAEEKAKKKAQKDPKKKEGKKKKEKSKGKGRNQNKGKKGGNKEKKEKKEKKKENKESPLERTRRNKHSKNEKHKGKAGKKNEEEFTGKSMGSLAGIATLRRAGDVTVMNSDSHKIVKSEFSIGPLQLEVSKTYGHGQSRSVKTAKAVTEELIGKITLKVKPDGSAHVKSVSFKKPENVEIRGSLGDQKKRSDNYLKSSVGKIRPMAAQRLLKMARYVLKSPSTVERS